MPSMIVVSTYRCLMQLCLLTIVVLGSPLAWAQETDQNAPVGTVGGAVHADPFTGTATTSIPIEIPPGRGGVQPDLVLVYGSSNGNGWLGQGWKLEKGVIERQTKFGVNYSGDDYVFRLSGINVELVNIGDDEYRAKVEGGFNRIKKMISPLDNRPYFEVTDKTGKKFIFGTEAATRVADQDNPDNIFRWCLERVEDVHGNYMTLSYTTDQGQAYLYQIDYTGNDIGGLAPTNQVKFYLEDRPDAPKMFVPNFLMKTAKRLKTIAVKANGNHYRTYALTYSVSSNTARSMLTQVKPYGKDAVISATGEVSGGAPLPSTTLTYTADAAGMSFTNVGHWLTNWCTSDQNLRPADFNGDGIQDLLCNSSPATSDGVGQFTPHGSIGSSCVEGRAGDFNGDGKSDVLCLQEVLTGLEIQNPILNYSWIVALSTGTGTFTTDTSWLNKNSFPLNSGASPYSIRMLDFDGDGRTDMGIDSVHWNSNDPLAFWAYRSDGIGSFIELGSPVFWCTNATLLEGDYNADGKADILCHTASGTTQVALATNAGWGPQGNWLTSWCPGDDFGTGEFNGDGKQDLWCHLTSGTTRVALSTGTSFIAEGDWLTNWCAVGRFQIGEFNGDGKQDLLCHIADGTTKVALSTGTAFIDKGDWLTGWCTTTGQPGIDLVVGLNGKGDFTGDGKEDLACHKNAQVSVAHAGSVGEQSDLLETLSNGLGGTTTLEYTPSTEYENTQLPYPVQTVSKLITNDSHGHVATMTYEYSGGFHHIPEREFRGFHYVKMTGQAGASGEQTITETWFHQGNGDVNNPYVPDGYLKGNPHRIDVRDENGQLYSATYTVYTADDNEQAPFFTPPLSVIHDLHDGTFKRTQTDFDYDSYGNITLEKQWGEIGQPADDRTVLRTFSPNATAWILSLPTYEGIFDDIAQGFEVAATNFYYDGTGSCNTPSGSAMPSKGNLTRVVQSLFGGTSPETGMTYDVYGNLTCIRDARGNMTTLTHDASQTFATTATNALGHQTNTTYYGVDGVAMNNGLYGQVKTVTDPNNATTTTRYDVFGRRTQVIQPNGLATTTYYNGFGTVGEQHIQTVTTAGLSTWTNFDGFGRTFKTRSTGTDSQIVVTEVYYDHRGGVTQESLPYFESGGTQQWTMFEYDPLGRVTKTTNPDGSRGLACYDDWVTVSIDANNHRHRTVRDAYDRVVTVQEYTGTYTSCDTSVGSPYSTTTYAYDVLGNLTTLSDAKGNVSTMTYDTLSRKTTMHDPDMGDWTYTYDAADNLTQQTDANSQTISFQYDALNRRTLKDYVGGGNVVYTYDGSTANRIGRLQNVQDSSGTSTFSYNKMGQVTTTDKLVDGVTYSMQTSYDGLGRVLNLTYPDGSLVTHSYNGPQLQAVIEGNSTYASYGGFNAQGQPGTLALDNGVTTTYAYHPQNFRLARLKTENESTILQDLGYTFDASGNVTNLTDPNHGTQILTYDSLDRLTSASGSAYPTAITYTYDQIGNMLSNSQVGTYTYPPSGSAHPHAVTTAGSKSYTYDANGNMTSGADRTITYDHENRPVTITKNGTTTTMLYDGDGGRVKKTVNDGTLTTATTYIGQLYVCEGIAAPLSCAKMVFAGDQRVAMKQTNGTVDYFHPDHLGSTSVLTNSNGVSEQDLAYEPYGETRVNTGGGNNNATVDEWKLEVGTFAGGNDLYQSSGLGQQTSATVSSLPIDGSQVYVTLSYKIGGQWDHDDSVYTASSNGGGGGSSGGGLIPQGQMQVVSATSDTGNMQKVLDGDSATKWSPYDSVNGPPHEMVLDLGGSYLVSEFRYLPDSWTKCTQYEVYVSMSNGNWSSAVATGTWANDATEKTASFTATLGAFLKIRYLNSYCYAAEHNVVGSSTSGGDSTPPTVSLTAPANGATVTGSVPVTATATDTVGVVGVQFLLDGNALGAEDLTSPYVVTWDTTQISTGSHTLSARARDAAGNTQTSSLVTVSIAPPSGGGLIPQGQLQVVSATSDTANMQKVLDGNGTTIWGASGANPHEMVLDLGGSYLVSEFRYLPYSWTKCTQYEVYVSTSNGNWSSAVATGTWANDATEKTASFTATLGAFLKIRYLNSYCYAAEHNVVGAVTSGGPAPLTITPMTMTVAGGGQQTFMGTGGTPPYAFIVQGDTTGGASVDFSTGLYTAGPHSGTTTVHMADSSVPELTADAVVTVAATGGASLIPQSQMSVVSVSADTANKDKVLDGNSTTKWGPSGGSPHEMVLDLGGSYLVSEFRYLPYSWTKCTQYEVYVSTSNGNWGSAVSTGTWANDNTEKIASFSATLATFLKIRYLNSYCYAAEHNVIGSSSGGSASLSPENPTIHLAAMNNPAQNGPSHVHRLDWEPTDFTPTTRLGGGLFSLRFGIPQPAIPLSNPLVHLVSHSGASSTTISPSAGTVLSGSTVTFSWSYTGGGSSGTDVAYKYTGKERDDSTDLYFYEARYYDATLGRFISADTIVPDPFDPQAFNRYAYVENNPIKYIDPDGAVAQLAPIVYRATIGGVTGGTAAFLAAYENTGRLSSTIFPTIAGATVGFLTGAVLTPTSALQAATTAGFFATAATAYLSDISGQVIGNSLTTGGLNLNGIDLLGGPLISAVTAPLSTFAGTKLTAEIVMRSPSALFSVGTKGTRSAFLVPQNPYMAGLIGAGLSGTMQGLAGVVGSSLPFDRFDFSSSGISPGFGIPTNISRSSSSSLSSNLNVNSSNSIGPGNSLSPFGGSLFSSPPGTGSVCSLCGVADFSIRGNYFGGGRFNNIFDEHI